jgi:hypothetical protein
MPAKRMNLRMIKDVLRLKLDAGLSHQQVAQALRISKGVVAKYVTLAATAGITDWAVVCDLGEHELESRLLRRPAQPSEFALPDFGRIHQELGRPGVTLALLWEEYVASHPGQRVWGRTQFYQH